jgi:protein-S-isoprenylcysteine O-methyltransferase Ste14
MWAYARIATFALATILLAYVFRASLRRPRSHGFYRFFVFEAILALFLFAVPLWFHDPLSLLQLISWALLLGSLILVVAGVRALHIHGRPDSAARQEPELLAFERTSRLVQEGIFHHIRHPLYTSLLLLTWGIFFKLLSGISATLAIVATTGLVLMADAEEAECVRVFGQEYRAYMRHTPRFIPHVY